MAKDDRCEECGCVLITISEIQCGLCDECGAKMVADIDGPPWVNMEELAWDWIAMTDEDTEYARASFEAAKAERASRKV